MIILAGSASSLSTPVKAVGTISPEIQLEAIYGLVIKQYS
jgi:hypothetical protein